MGKPIEPDEKRAMVEMFDSLPDDTQNKYYLVAKEFNRSISACFNAIKKAKLEVREVKLFDHKTFPF